MDAFNLEFDEAGQLRRRGGPLQAWGGPTFVSGQREGDRRTDEASSSPAAPAVSAGETAATRTDTAADAVVAAREGGSGLSSSAERLSGCNSPCPDEGRCPRRRSRGRLSRERSHDERSQGDRSQDGQSAAGRSSGIRSRARSTDSESRSRSSGDRSRQRSLGRQSRGRSSDRPRIRPADHAMSGASAEIRAALREAEAVAAQLPAIRFPTYRTVSREPLGARKVYEGKRLSDVPFVEMIDKIVFSWDGKLLLAIRRRKEPLLYSTDWEVSRTLSARRLKRKVSSAVYWLDRDLGLD